MSILESLTAGAVVSGIDPAGPVTVVAIRWHGDAVLTLTYKLGDGDPQERLLYRSDEGTFEVNEGTNRAWSFDGDGHLFRVAAEARRIQMAHLFDPYLALTSSTVEPLPHQIEAVYKEMIPRQPLRFLLADDPGAGKTIMAGLYIKELIIRGDVERCLIVAPGSLVSQWQDEMKEKFNLTFELITKDMLDSAHIVDPFKDKNLLIARVDQIARREDIVERLGHADWDLVVVDEAHRMSAHHYGQEITKTKKYILGETLGRTARHFLLMTATPHAGKEDDFQLFLALLDADRFEGRFRDGVHQIDPSDLMRRMVKEKLLTFDGRKLFPERRAYTVKYDLSPDELMLYTEVTEYVREQMNRADRLANEGQGRRGNTVGFALTLLQRRLASSPEAIYQSLNRRRKRLENRVIEERQAVRAAALGMTPQEERLSALLSDAPEGFDVEAFEDLDGDEREELEAEIVDAATAAATVEELEFEIVILKSLEKLAFDLRGKHVDAKWVQLSKLLSDTPEMFTEDGNRRKMIIFTEHKDTLNYLVDRLRTFLGSAENEAVVHISGSTPREQRRAIQQRFTQDKDCLILVATDAAGEGINLQSAHLVINYDLPWNPNRLEQRFGRVHRIGQREVCHMWNLVADDTREAQVYLRLLDKIEQQQKAYKGQIFDVLGDSLSGAQLRDLMIQAIRYGEQPEVKDMINEVIDATVGEKVRQAIEEPALAAETLGLADLEVIRQQMDEAEMRRLQPNYIKQFFEKAFQVLGGSMREREPGRFEITSVPPVLRQRDRQIGVGNPVLDKYERITFKKELMNMPGVPVADLIAPGHPLLASVIDVILERHGGILRQGTVLIDDKTQDDTPRVMVILEHAVVDARPTRDRPHTVVSRRFEFVEVPRDGEPMTAGYAPYLDYRPPTEEESATLEAVMQDGWLSTDLEAVGTDHAIAIAVPEHLAQVRIHTEARVDATLAAVHERLTREIAHWDNRGNELQLRADTGNMPQMNVDKARARADGLALRLQNRTKQLEQERMLRALPPKVVGGALVIPASLLTDEDDQSVVPDVFGIDRGEVEQRAVDAVLAAEAARGWTAVDMNEEQPNHPGYDVRSVRKVSPDEPEQVRHIEVKGRIAGATTVTVSRNEILTSLNSLDKYVLALVRVSPDGTDTVRYLKHPFESAMEDILFDVCSVNFVWSDLWDRAESPA